MGGKYSIVAKKYIGSFYFDYSDFNVPNAIVLLFIAIYCFAKYEYVEIRKHS